MKLTKSIAFILARKNSKRFKFKNIKKLGKLSLIEHSILAVKNSNCFDRIIVSSDDNKILSLSKKYKKIEFLKRPKELARDNSKALDVLLYYCKKLKLTKNYQFIGLFLPTAPFKNSKHIKEGLKIIKNTKVDNVISMCKMSTPIHFALKEQNSLMKPFFKNSPLIKNNTRSQNQMNTYRPNGSFWICNIKSLVKNKSLYKGKIKKYEMNIFQSIDIDTKFDFEVAKIIYEKKLYD